MNKTAVGVKTTAVNVILEDELLALIDAEAIRSDLRRSQLMRRILREHYGVKRK